MRKNDLFYALFPPLIPLMFFYPWICWLIVLAVTALLYGLDKLAAIRQWHRVPECALLFWTLAGGTPTAVLMMLLCRHKIKKTAFMIPFLLVVLIQAAALYYAWSRGWFSPDRPSGGG